MKNSRDPGSYFNPCERGFQYQERASKQNPTSVSTWKRTTPKNVQGLDGRAERRENKDVRNRMNSKACRKNNTRAKRKRYALITMVADRERRIQVCRDEAQKTDLTPT